MEAARVGEWITVDVAGQPDRAYLAQPQGGAGPAVLVLHAWWGLNATFQGFCDRLAADGFVALAPDLYGAGQLADTIEGAEALVKAFDFDAATARAEAAIAHVQSLTGAQRLGTIGCSLGGALALELSAERPDAVAAVVVYYDAYPRDYSASTAAYLVHLAETDDYTPADAIEPMRAELQKAGRDADIIVYPGTGHWFAEPERADAYDAQAAELAWQRTLEFLRKRLS
jgi:carboxymethylenebutenolidase